MREYDYVILGGGITGLFAGYLCRLKGYKYVILEKESISGGLSRSFEKGGFVFDIGGHFLRFYNSEIQRIFENELDIKFNKTKKNAAVYLNDKFLKAPIQDNKIYQHHTEKLKKSNNLKDFFTKNFSWKLNLDFMLPYNSKLWLYPLDTISSDWCTRYVKTDKSEQEYNSYFYYPDTNKGFYLIIESLLNQDLNIEYNAAVKKIDMANHIINYNNDDIKYKNIISTIPLPDFTHYLTGSYCKYKNYFRFVSNFILNLGFKEKNYNKKFHWIYFPERDIPFYRIGCYHNIIKNNMPKENMSSYYIEFSFVANDIKFTQNYKKYILNKLKKIGIINNDENLLVVQYNHIKYGYVIEDKITQKLLDEWIPYFHKNNIYLAGRYSEWKYIAIEEGLVSVMNNII